MYIQTCTHECMRLETLEELTKNCRSFVSVYKNVYGMVMMKRSAEKRREELWNSSRVMVIDAQLKLQWNAYTYTHSHTHIASAGKQNPFASFITGNWRLNVQKKRQKKININKRMSACTCLSVCMCVWIYAYAYVHNDDRSETETVPKRQMEAKRRAPTANLPVSLSVC